MKKTDNQLMAKILFLAILILENLDELEMSNFFTRQLKNRGKAFKKQLEFIVKGTFDELHKIGERNSHLDISFDMTVKFDEFYNQFVETKTYEKEQ
jgi:hypothetical protein